MSKSVPAMAPLSPPYRNTPYDNPTWVMFYDSDTAKPYFFNTKTGDTSWEDPEPPHGAEAYAIEEEKAKILAKSGVIDEDEMLEALEKNYYLQNVIEKEIDRGTPPYLSQEWRTRPARKQAERDSKQYAYKEGSEVYNVWYHKYTGDRFDGSVREAAQTLCDPWLDSGWTEADSRKAEEASFCLWFAKGCCTRGSSCKYKHRVPSRRDETDQMIDCFGRERHAGHKDDMGGVGSFMKECRCLYISEIKIDRTHPDCIQRLEAQLWKLFHPWGPIESIRVIPNKVIAFVKFEYRSAAEFAKVACADQPCGIADAINVRWAFEDPNPRAIEQAVIDTRDMFFKLVEQRISIMSVKEREDLGLEKPASGELEDRFEIHVDEEGGDNCS